MVTVNDYTRVPGKNMPLFMITLWQICDFYIFFTVAFSDEQQKRGNKITNPS